MKFTKEDYEDMENQLRFMKFIERLKQNPDAEKTLKAAEAIYEETWPQVKLQYRRGYTGEHAFDRLNK